MFNCGYCCSSNNRALTLPPISLAQVCCNPSPSVHPSWFYANSFTPSTVSSLHSTPRPPTPKPPSIFSGLSPETDGSCEQMIPSPKTKTKAWSKPNRICWSLPRRQAGKLMLQLIQDLTEAHRERGGRQVVTKKQGALWGSHPDWRVHLTWRPSDAPHRYLLVTL